MIKKIRALRENTLVVNSFYLVAASGVVAVLGFAFWAVVARSFADSEVGLAATLLSLSSLLSLLSLAGFDTTFIRFLPKSQRKEAYINTGLVISTILSIVLSTVTVCLLPLAAPELAFVTQTPLYALGFIIFTAFTTLNTLTNSVFTAYRRTFYILAINALFSIVKLVLPLLFIGGDAMLIFTIAGIAQAIGAMLSFWAMYRRFGHRFRLRVERDLLRLSRKYALIVYFSSVLNLLPPAILPLIITQQLGPASSAYYYMAFTIATMLYTVAYSAMQSAFAESSHSEEALRANLVKASKFLGVLLVPAIVALVIVAPYILAVFGETYAADGASVLQLFALGGLVVAVYSAAGMVFKVRHANAALVTMNCVYASVIVGGSTLFIGAHGLPAVAVAWVAGNAAAVFAGVLVYRFTRRR